MGGSDPQSGGAPERAPARYAWGLNHLDWVAPWFDGWRDDGATVAARGGPLHAALNAQNGVPGRAPVRFVAQDALPEGAAYEGFIHAHGLCPTRDNLHDFFNGLCWLRFPQTKRRLNQLQARQIATDGVRPVRGPVRDALTVLDENGAFLLAPQALWQALRARQWQTLFVEMRPLWAQARFVVFGHALLEKLVQPRKDLTAHVYVMQSAINSVAYGDVGAFDASWAADLTADHLASKPFTPLPVLGIPGWWPQNEDFSFYDDPLVFRPRRPT